MRKLFPVRFMTPARISSLGRKRRVKCLMTDVQVKLRKGGRIVSVRQWLVCWS